MHVMDISNLDRPATLSNINAHCRRALSRNSKISARAHVLHDASV
jgi:hypothetical protein